MFLLLGADEKSVDVVLAQKLVAFVTMAILGFVASLQAVQRGARDVDAANHR